MLKKIIPFVFGIVVLVAIGCGDDGGPDPVIELNDPNSPRQPTGVSGIGGGAPVAPPDSSAATSKADTK